MMLFHEAANEAAMVCGVYAALSAAFAVYAFANTLIFKLSLKYKLVSALSAAVNLILLLGIADYYISYEYDRPQVFLGKITGEVPIIFIAVILILITISEIIIYIYIDRAHQKMLTPEAIKESLDMLPDGICFSDAEGAPILVNIQMNKLCSEIFGTEIMNVQSFWEELKKGRVRDGVKVLRNEPAVSIRTKDRRIWDFRYNTLHTAGFNVIEITAYDVTRESELTLELARRNTLLNDINKRLRNFNRHIEELTREKEILKTKIKVHDDLGRALLAFRSYVLLSREARNRDKLLELWRQTAETMKYEAVHNDIEDEWELVLEAAELMNVHIVKTGMMPESYAKKQVFLTALREVLSNTVKHAGGHVLYILIETDDNETTIKFTNDGKPPVSPIKETGGLKNLRSIVENAGGSMTIDSIPRFVMYIRFTK